MLKLNESRNKTLSINLISSYMYSLKNVYIHVGVKVFSRYMYIVSWHVVTTRTVFKIKILRNIKCTKQEQSKHRHLKERRGRIRYHGWVSILCWLFDPTYKDLKRVCWVCVQYACIWLMHVYCTQLYYVGYWKWDICEYN